MINKDKIGAILKQRIYLCGLSQKKFSEITGVGLSTLKKYFKGNCYYSVDTLAIFAEVLHCSYNYLLGKSETAEPEFEDIRDKTHLSDGAIERLLDAADSYERGDKRKIDVISNFLQNERAMDYLFSYLYSPIGDKDKDGDKVYFGNMQNVLMHSEVMYVGEETVYVPDLESIYLAGIMREIQNFKCELGFDHSRRFHASPTIQK